ncbi:MAG TPA: phosphatase PAP2 family protein [Mycobacteriales bacterium]|nr:phosphatase PAP2 family protein [Mycobacteriales bacterium]
MSILKPAGERTAWQELGQAGRRAVPIFVGIGVVVVLLGLLITKVLKDTGFADADAGVNRWFAKHRGSTLNTLTHLGTLFGETITIVACTAITVVLFRVIFHRWRESVILTICVVGQSLIFLITTILIDRDRPPVPHLDDSPPTSSFPSGHTAAATAYWAGTALIVAWHLRDRWLGKLITVIGLLIPIMVATCRMYRGMHFPTDTATSYLFALALLAVAFRALPLGEGSRDPGTVRRRVTPLRSG